MTKIIAIIQARMSSTRLPGKVLKPLGIRTVVGQVVHQLSFAKHINAVVLATSVDASDDALAEWAVNTKIPCVRGSLNDVLDRYYTAAKHYGADVIVRITADCPLIDPTVVDAVVERFIAEGVDYCSNVNPPTFPDGLDTEVFTVAALERAWKEATLPSEREHVTPYIRNHSELFQAANLERTPSLEHLRWTLDTPDDYEFLCRVIERLEQPNSFIPLNDVVTLIEQDKTLLTINADLKRNEGYAKSLQGEQL